MPSLSLQLETFQSTQTDKPRQSLIDTSDLAGQLADVLRLVIVPLERPLRSSFRDLIFCDVGAGGSEPRIGGMILAMCAADVAKLEMSVMSNLLSLKLQYTCRMEFLGLGIPVQGGRSSAVYGFQSSSALQRHVRKHT